MSLRHRFKDVVKHCRNKECGKRLVIRNARDVERRTSCSHSCRMKARYQEGELDAPLAKAQSYRRGLKGHRPPKDVRVCKKCGNNYHPNGPKQIWCFNCCPDESARARLRRYGISQPEFDAMLLRQNGGCAICKTPSRLVVDHDHDCCVSDKTCGKCVRGLVCLSCNLLLGALTIDRTWLVKATRYLKREV